MTNSGKHCDKRRNCLFWAISPFVTMFFRKRFTVEASESVYMRERVKVIQPFLYICNRRLWKHLGKNNGNLFTWKYNYWKKFKALWQKVLNLCNLFLCHTVFKSFLLQRSQKGLLLHLLTAVWTWASFRLLAIWSQPHQVYAANSLNVQHRSYYRSPVPTRTSILVIIMFITRILVLVGNRY